MFANQLLNRLTPGGFTGRLGLRLVMVAIVTTAILVTALPAKTTEAATVGNCATVVSYPDTAIGKIRWAGMAQCFSMFLEHGYTYTITVDAGDRAYAGSTNYMEPLGDSVLVLFRSNTNRIQINDPFNSAHFDYVGMNDDYAIPTHLGSRITFEVSGERGRSTQFVARVSGFGDAVGRYSISVTRSVQADVDACEHVFACQ